MRVVTAPLPAPIIEGLVDLFGARVASDAQQFVQIVLGDADKARSVFPDLPLHGEAHDRVALALGEIHELDPDFAAARERRALAGPLDTAADFQCAVPVIECEPLDISDLGQFALGKDQAHARRGDVRDASHRAVEVGRVQPGFTTGGHRLLRSLVGLLRLGVVGCAHGVENGLFASRLWRNHPRIGFSCRRASGDAGDRLLE